MRKTKYPFYLTLALLICSFSTDQTQSTHLLSAPLPPLSEYVKAIACSAVAITFISSYLLSSYLFPPCNDEEEEEDPPQRPFLHIHHPLYHPRHTTVKQNPSSLIMHPLKLIFHSSLSSNNQWLQIQPTTTTTTSNNNNNNIICLFRLHTFSLLPTFQKYMC